MVGRSCFWAKSERMSDDNDDDSGYYSNRATVFSFHQ